LVSLPDGLPCGLGAQIACYGAGRMKRAIHIFPDTREHPFIEELRSRFDSLHGLIAAHVTLVFPFDSPMTDSDLVQHCREQVATFKPFSFTVGPPERSENDLYWLPIRPVPTMLSALSAALNSGPLGGLKSGLREFQPHITVARPPLSPEIESALQATGSHTCTLEANSITIERILPDGASEVIQAIPFSF
jgi:2'-5' RNA ligase